MNRAAPPPRRRRRRPGGGAGRERRPAAGASSSEPSTGWSPPVRRARSPSSATATARCASPAATRTSPRGRPLRATDRYRVGSATKTFVATVVLQLAGEGRLGLSDSVERWLPGLVPDGGAITVRQLLNHTSGLADYAPDEDDTFIRRVLADRRRTWDAARARRHRHGAAAALRPRRALVVLEHGLHPARADRRGGERQPARDGAARRASSHRCACAPRASTPGRGSPGATRTATRASARGAASTSASSTRRGRARPARSSRPRATSRASTAPSSAAGCCAPTCSRRCARPWPRAPASRRTGSG